MLGVRGLVAYVCMAATDAFEGTAIFRKIRSEYIVHENLIVLTVVADEVAEVIFCSPLRQPSRKVGESRVNFSVQHSQSSLFLI